MSMKNCSMSFVHERIKTNYNIMEFSLSEYEITYYQANLIHRIIKL